MSIYDLGCENETPFFEKCCIFDFKIEVHYLSLLSCHYKIIRSKYSILKFHKSDTDYKFYLIYSLVKPMKERVKCYMNMNIL